MPGSTGLPTSASRNSDVGGPGHQLPLVLSQVWRPHGSHREMIRRSDPTPLSPQGVDGCSMKSLSHSENFARSAALRPLVSPPRTTRGFTRLVDQPTTTLHHPQTARSNHSPPPTSAAPRLRHMQFP